VALGEEIPAQRRPLSLSGGYSRSLPLGIGMNLGSSYKTGSSDLSSVVRVNLGLRKSLEGGQFVALRGRVDLADLSIADWSVSAEYTAVMSGLGQTVRATQSVPPARSSLSWSYSPGGEVGQVGLSASGSQDSGDYGYNGQLTYSAYVMDTSLTYDYESSAAGSHTLALTASSALVFADGAFGVSRPVRDSFLIVSPHRSLREYQVGINPTGDGHAARAGRLLPAVLPNLSSYHANTIILDIPDLPIGYDLGSEEYTLIPRYRSGAVLRVGMDGAVLLLGTLTEPDGSPLALQTGQVISFGNADEQPSLFFTNRTGQFEVAGLSHGEYRVELFDGRSTPAFHIPDGHQGIYEIGSLPLSGEIGADEPVVPEAVETDLQRNLALQAERRYWRSRPDAPELLSVWLGSSLDTASVELADRLDSPLVEIDRVDLTDGISTVTYIAEGRFLIGLAGVIELTFLDLGELAPQEYLVGVAVRFTGEMNGRSVDQMSAMYGWMLALFDDQWMTELATGVSSENVVAQTTTVGETEILYSFDRSDGSIRVEYRDNWYDEIERSITEARR